MGRAACIAAATRPPIPDWRTHPHRHHQLRSLRASCWRRQDGAHSVGGITTELTQLRLQVAKLSIVQVEAEVILAHTICRDELKAATGDSPAQLETAFETMTAPVAKKGASRHPHPARELDKAHEGREGDLGLNQPLLTAESFRSH